MGSIHENCCLSLHQIFSKFYYCGKCLDFVISQIGLNFLSEYAVLQVILFKNYLYSCIYNAIYSLMSLLASQSYFFEVTDSNLYALALCQNDIVLETMTPCELKKNKNIKIAELLTTTIKPKQINKQIDSLLLQCRIIKEKLQLVRKMINKLPFQFPLMVCAPMVQQSQLPFRLLTRKYGANLCYTPMLHSKMMTTQKKYKAQNFTTCPEDRPLVAQICGHDPQTMVKAAKMLEDQVDAIDVNFGCPQGIAKRGHYGSYLLQQPNLVYDIVKALVDNVKVPIFCKIRIRKTQQKTFQVVDKIISAGCSLLTVHGRTKEQNKDKVGSCDWKMIKKIKQYVNIPVVANGGIHNFKDVQKCLEATGVDGVMSAQSLLENPALFSGKVHDLDQLALQYLTLAEKHPGAQASCIRAHLFKMLFKGLAQNVDLRQRMTKAQTMEQFRNIVTELKQRRAGQLPENKFGWYKRYWQKCYVKPEYDQQKQKMEQQKQCEGFLNVQLKIMGEQKQKQPAA